MYQGSQDQKACRRAERELNLPLGFMAWMAVVSLGITFVVSCFGPQVLKNVLTSSCVVSCTSLWENCLNFNSLINSYNECVTLKKRLIVF